MLRHNTMGITSSKTTCQIITANGGTKVKMSNTKRTIITTVILKSFGIHIWLTALHKPNTQETHEI